MKRFLTAALALVMVLSLCACGSKETPTEDPGKSDTKNTETNPMVITDPVTLRFASAVPAVLTTRISARSSRSSVVTAFCRRDPR